VGSPSFQLIIPLQDRLSDIFFIFISHDSGSLLVESGRISPLIESRRSANARFRVELRFAKVSTSVMVIGIKLTSSIAIGVSMSWVWGVVCQHNCFMRTIKWKQCLPCLHSRPAGNFYHEWSIQFYKFNSTPSNWIDQFCQNLELNRLQSSIQIIELFWRLVGAHIMSAHIIPSVVSKRKQTCTCCELLLPWSPCYPSEDLKIQNGKKVTSQPTIQ
jgi:hypothetical protein